MRYLAGELVFAYGSNLSFAQMVSRCPSAEYVTRAELRDHELAFAGWSERWQGPVATYVASPRRRLRGVVFSVSRKDLGRLDRFEGVPRVYDRQRVLVHVARRVLPVFAYRLAGFDALAAPSPAYLELIGLAYRDWGFPRRHLRRAVRMGEVEQV